MPRNATQNQPLAADIRPVMATLPEIKIFRAGRHTDASGNERTYTPEDVRRIAEVYNSQTAHVAPAVKGHPEADKPAFGWVQKLRYEGGELFATFKEVAEEFAEELRAGRYKFRSIAHYPSGLLKHVGFLGAVPPAVKGLGEIPAFADDVCRVFFAEESASPIADENQQQPNRKTAMDEQALQQLTELITGLTASVNELLAELRAGKKPAANDAAATAQKEEPTEGVETPPKPASAFGEGDSLEARIETLQREIRAAQFREFLGGDEMKTRVTPAMQPKVTEIMNCLAESGQTLRFSDAEGKQQEGAAVDLFKQFLQGLPAQYAEGELSGYGVPAGNAEHAKEIDDLAKLTSRRV
ncbi:MAG: hypothetical protein EKK55_15615 [Rhodocyclaceae bacterium]|nr:MAG: hypothetical protein EKK55_15615 [Rhodocyclaceae bacterium]